MNDQVITSVNIRNCGTAFCLVDKYCFGGHGCWRCDRENSAPGTGDVKYCGSCDADDFKYLGGVSGLYWWQSIW